MDFLHAVQHVLKYEGGLVDDPRDAGGITKYGISLRAYPDLGPEGIKNLTVQEAQDLYKRDYWDAVRCEELPCDLRLMVLDCAVNQGVRFATKTLQSVVDTVPDGVIGPKTLDAVLESDIQYVLRKYAFLRYKRYEQHKRFDVYGDGWMTRLLDVTVRTKG